VGERTQGMNRRTFLARASGILAAPRAARAQPAGRIYRIGMLDVVPAAANAANLAAFRKGLAALGYVEGQNVVIEYRSADGRAERFPGLAAELVRLDVDVIVTRGTPAALAAKHATATIPIVMASSGDPLATGLAASLAAPGGNVTGLSAFATETQGKLLEVLKELVPPLTRVACLFNMGNPVLRKQWREARAAARSLALQTLLVDVRSGDDLDRAFDSLVAQRAGGVIVGVDAVTQAHRKEVVEELARRRLPAISREREFADAGGLASYGVHYADSYRLAARYVDKILKGARPAGLPIEQPTRLELVINLRTARALGLTIPPALAQRADEIIE
jgi:putative ABC transport system substrate-binding protein